MCNGKHRGIRWASVLALVAVLTSLALAPVGGAAQRVYSYDGPLENVVADWNAHTADALINAPAAATPGLGQGVAPLHFAMVHGAIYDAVIMIEGGYQPYLANLPQAPRSASKAAAVATAAHDVLVAVVSDPRAQAAVTPQPAPSAAIVARLDGLLATTLAAALAADGPASVAAGGAAGKVAAAAMMADRANDGRYVPLNPPLKAGDEPGEWRPELPAFVSDPNAWLSQVDPFMLNSPSQFRSKGPNALTSEAYARDYNEVKALGAKTGSTRTPAQEAMADFYNTNGFEIINRAFRNIAVDQKLTLVQQARYFAMLHLTNADTVINCWNDKVYWGFWRPITAIRQGESDGNPQTIGDPTWEPLLPTPPYSDHLSGYNCIAGAFSFAAQAYFGKNDMTYRLSKAGTTLTRDFTSFTALSVEIIDVRVYHGVHFREANFQAEILGKNVAGWMTQNYFQPVAPAPPPTGTGGTLPGLPSTGAGGGLRSAPVGWLVLLAGSGTLALGWYLRRRLTRA